MNIATEENQKTAQQSTEQNTYVAPYVDVEATDTGYVLYAEMPGVNREGIEVTVDDGNLVIAGHRQALAVGGDQLHRETRRLNFRRVYELDPSIDADKISARIEQGILTVTLPKAENQKPRRIALD